MLVFRLLFWGICGMIAYDGELHLDSGFQLPQRVRFDWLVDIFLSCYTCLGNEVVGLSTFLDGSTVFYIQNEDEILAISTTSTYYL